MDGFLARVFSIYAVILEPFGSPDFGPKLATGLLALATIVLLCFLVSSLPHAYRLRSALRVILGTNIPDEEGGKRESFENNYYAIHKALLSNKTVCTAWQEFQKTLIVGGNSQKPTVIASVRPSDFFNPRRLLVQYDFVRAIPNYFVGLGLLGTFIGLIAALTFSAKSITEATDQESIKEALNKLLVTAGAKFYISASGLVASLLLSVVIALVIRHLHHRVREINGALEERLLFASEQDIAERQLLIQQDSLTELKLFNTNIAMRIGDAVRSAIEASNDRVTSKLADIANDFSKLIESSGAGAGVAVRDAMKNALDESLKQASSAIADVAAELKRFPAQLSAAAASIQDVGSKVVAQQQIITEQMKTAVNSVLSDTGNGIAAKIESGTQTFATSVAKSSAGFESSASRLETVLQRFSSGEDGYLDALSRLTNKHVELQTRIETISSEVASASNSVASASAGIDKNLTRLIDELESVTRLTAETNRYTQESQAATRVVIEALNRQMATHLQRFNDVDETLGRVFNQIAAHLELQSKTMNELLSTMDQALARAVNQFEEIIDELVGAKQR
jgi:archaellum component FlaC